MTRPVRGLARRQLRRWSAYTLIEILVSTALTLMLLMAVVQIFASVSEGIANSRAALEMADQLRAAQMTLQRDLEGVTATMSPPRSPAAGEGYFEYTEGPIGPAKSIESVAFNTDLSEPDSTVGDIDDVLMFTTRSRSTPFVGRLAGNAVESQEAEVAWFLRGRTLYRRVLLVLPNAALTSPEAGFFNTNDISVRNSHAGGALAANSLSDLTRPENRFAHRVANRTPYHPHFTYSGSNIVRSNWANLGLPTLRECSFSTWVAGAALPAANLGTVGTFDAWLNPHPASGQDKDTGALTDYLGDRVGEDVILTNVIGFDVKAWDDNAPVLRDTTSGTPFTLLPGDPGYIVKLRECVRNDNTGNVLIVGRGAYVDLDYLCHIQDPSLSGTVPSDTLVRKHLGSSTFGWRGNVSSRVAGTAQFTSSNPSPTILSAVYDTWSTHYECDGVNTDAFDVAGISTDGDSLTDEGTDGFDNNGDGVVDDADEQEAPPPYAVPLRGIQVRIRVFEPASRQIREVTVVQDFLAK